MPSKSASRSRPRAAPAERDAAPGDIDAHIDAPLGVFDSGLGGLTVVRALRRALPRERVVYLGDMARLPYGTKSAETVTRYSLQIAEFLVARGVKYLVVACNTASAHALVELRRRLPVPVMGVVEPGARLAATRTRSGMIGVIGTLATVASGAYERALQAVRPDLVIFSHPCPLFVPLAEEGWLDHPVTHEVARTYLGELRQQGGDLDTLVLGCTHYPLLRPTIAAVAEEVFGHQVQLIDSATAVADEVRADLDRRRIAVGAGASERPPDQFFVTDESRFTELARRFLGEAPTVEHADI